MTTHRLLVADPDGDARADAAESLRTSLDDLDVAVETAGTVADASATLSGDTAAVIAEYDFSDGTGFDVFHRAEETCPDAGRVLYTDTDPDTLDTDELRGTIVEYVGKGSPFGADRLAGLVRTTVEDRTGRNYPLPRDEDERLAALRSYGLDDPRLRESLDRITDLAARHFGVETASINLIEEHSQEFLACHGPAGDWEPTEREDSICTFTILEDEGVMTVPDVAEDPRFESRTDQFGGMGIRAYMGATLVTPGGLAIGTLCVYDDEPRSFSAADERYLRDLARTTMDLIDLRTRADAATDRREEAGGTGEPAGVDR